MFVRFCKFRYMFVRTFCIYTYRYALYDVFSSIDAYSCMFFPVHIPHLTNDGGREWWMTRRYVAGIAYLTGILYMYIYIYIPHWQFP